MHPTLTRFLTTLTFIATLGVLAACQSGATPVVPRTITVLAAASLSDAFQEMIPAFTKAHPGVSIQMTFGNSTALAQQIVEGAPADVYASAGDPQMQTVVESGRVAADSPQPFLKNELVAIISKTSGTTMTTLQDFAVPGNALVLVDPKVPAGQYAQEYLENANFDPGFDPSYKESVLANVVSYELTVSAALSKLELGEADAGILYVSDAARALPGTIITIPIPAELNVVSIYPIAPLADSQAPDTAQEFINFVLSDEGQTILENHGFVSIRAEE